MPANRSFRALSLFAFSLFRPSKLADTLPRNLEDYSAGLEDEEEASSDALRGPICSQVAPSGRKLSQHKWLRRTTTTIVRKIVAPKWARDFAAGQIDSLSLALDLFLRLARSLARARLAKPRLAPESRVIYSQERAILQDFCGRRAEKMETR